MTEDMGNIELESDLEGIDFGDIETDDEIVGIGAADDEKKAAPKPATRKAAPAKAAAAKVAAAKKAASKKAAAKAAPVKAAPAKAAAKKAASAKAAPVKAAPAKAAAKKAAPKRAVVKEAPAKKRAAGNPKTERVAPEGKMDPRSALKQGLIKLDDQGRDMPFKPGSAMRWYLEQALLPGGVTEATLEKNAIKMGYDHRYQRAVLVSGQNGGTSGRPYATTHTWNIEVTEGKNPRIMASNLKRIAFYKKIGRLFKK
jgi:hypothetical protein